MNSDDLVIRTILDLAKSVYPDAPVGWLLGIAVGILRRQGVLRKDIIRLVDAAIDSIGYTKDLPS